MDRKQVIVISLLVIAVVLSTASVLMNAQILNNLEINEQSGPHTANVVFEISEPEVESDSDVLADEESEENG